MKNDNEKTLNDFLGKGALGKTKNPTKKSTKNVVLDEREGLIERVDKVLVTRDGKQLLREQY